MTGARRTRDDYIDAAFAALATNGDARGTASVSMDTLAAIVGVSRTTMYRWWPTTSDVIADVAVHRAVSPDGWDERFLQQDPAGGVAAALQASLLGFPTDSSVWSRCWGASWPDTDRRRTIALHEQAWIERCARWLADADQYEHDPPWIDVAISFRAFVEGAVLFVSVIRPSLTAGWTDDEIGFIATTGAALAGELASSMSGPSRLLPRVADLHRSPADRSSAQVDALDTMAGLIMNPAPDTGSGTAIEVERVIDIEALARRLDVTPRRLYLLWPKAADLNRDLVVEALTRQQEAVEHRTRRAFAIAVGGSYNAFEELFASLFQAVLDA